MDFDEVINKVFEKQDIMEMLWENTNLLVGAVDVSTGHYVYLNNRWEEVLGYTEKELMSKPFLEFVHPEDHNVTEGVYHDENDNLDYIFMNRYLAKDGTIRLVKWLSSMRSADGRYHLGVAISE